MKALKVKDFEANTETKMWVRRFAMSLGSCYHQPCSCLCEMDPGWMVEGQATMEVEPRLPQLPNGWLSRQSRQSSLYVILAQGNKGETVMSSSF